MKDTSEYRTKTSYLERSNGRIKGFWPVAIDVGYSAVKVFSPNVVARFPSYAKRIEPDFAYAAETPESSILYKNMDTGEMWLVGEKAQDLMSANDTSDSEASLYGRERYSTEIFRVITQVGLGVSMRNNDHGKYEKDQIVVQTGLPDQYMSDEEDLRDAFVGKHNFALMIGDGQWEIFKFELRPEDVFVMSQPKGTLFSVCIDKNGKFRKEAGTYLNSSVLVFDPGFGTLDVFPINEGTVGHGETYTDLGMKRILKETSLLIRQEYHEEIPVPAMQKYLAKGVIRHFDKKSFRSDEYPFGDLLQAATEKVCNEAINRMVSTFMPTDYDFMIITGGTGAAWYDQIKEKFKNISTLKLIAGNQNDELPFVFSNVRGYYFYRFNHLGTDTK